MAKAALRGKAIALTAHITGRHASSQKEGNPTVGWAIQAVLISPHKEVGSRRLLTGTWYWLRPRFLVCAPEFSAYSFSTFSPLSLLPNDPKCLLHSRHHICNERGRTRDERNFPWVALSFYSKWNNFHPGPAHPPWLDSRLFQWSELVTTDPQAYGQLF